MARLNEEFQLTFHEVDSSIQIEFGEDPVTFSIGEIKQIVSIPVVFEENSNFFPVRIADHQELEVLFGDVVVAITGSYTDLNNIPTIYSLLQTINGYGSSKTQSLKNINGTIRWIDD
jgi:hypothetical protein